MNIRSYCCILLFFLAGCTTSEQLVYQDLSFLYGEDSPVLKTRTYFAGNDSVTLFLSISKKQNLRSFSDLLGRYRFKGKISSHYSDGDIVTLDSISLTISQKWESDDRMVLGFTLPKRGVEDILFISIYDLKKGQVRLLDIGQIFREDSPAKIVLLTNFDGEPLISEYFNSETRFKLKTDFDIDSISFNLYNTSFSPAAPPHATRLSILDPASIQADSSGTVSFGSDLNFSQDALLVFNVNNVLPGCFSYLVKTGSYPSLSSLNDLIEPLIYITTPDELRKLKTSDFPKKELDNFWLNVGGSYEYSRKLIKHYYTRVEFANRFFTSYKEGWKTDKGMIFIIFGRPDVVNRFGDYEEWHYEHLLKKDFYTFTFRKQPMFLADDNYQLVRKEEYSNVWFPMVEKWRKGIIIKNSK